MSEESGWGWGSVWNKITTTSSSVTKSVQTWTDKNILGIDDEQNSTENTTQNNETAQTSSDSNSNENNNSQTTSEPSQSQQPSETSTTDPLLAVENTVISVFNNLVSGGKELAQSEEIQFVKQIASNFAHTSLNATKQLYDQVVSNDGVVHKIDKALENVGKKAKELIITETTHQHDALDKSDNEKKSNSPSTEKYQPNFKEFFESLGGDGFVNSLKLLGDEALKSNLNLEKKDVLTLIEQILNGEKISEDALTEQLTLKTKVSEEVFEIIQKSKANTSQIVKDFTSNDFSSLSANDISEKAMKALDDNRKESIRALAELTSMAVKQLTVLSSKNSNELPAEWKESEDNANEKSEMSVSIAKIAQKHSILFVQELSNIASSFFANSTKEIFNFAKENSKEDPLEDLDSMCKSFNSDLLVQGNFAISIITETCLPNVISILKSRV